MIETVFSHTGILETHNKEKGIPSPLEQTIAEGLVSSGGGYSLGESGSC